MPTEGVMEIDEADDEVSVKRDVLRSLTKSGGLRTSVAKLSGSSRGIPSEKDFHFYNNFREFRNPVEEIDKTSKYLLEKVGKSEKLFGKHIPFPSERDVELDDDVGLDWLVNINDEIFERFDISLDEFNARRDEEERTGVRNMRVDEDDEAENGFRVVTGKKSKKSSHGCDRNIEGGNSVKMAAKLKPKVPFHVPSIPRPQDEYKIIVNNANQPFDHVWLQKSEDTSRFLHPLEKYSFIDFVDKFDSIEPVEPLPVEVTPFKFVEEVKDLKQLAIKLRDVDEFAVDLEHNQYRSFQGITCLMQISTRSEDFVIDTLKLRVHIGPHLREVFKDPTKRKVLHGANHDILWLQRDFGIYVCNMFDTGQASRVLKLERHSLEYLLNQFCGVAANKEYQNADWRIRPLPEEMLKYAREDTHYLLYIYDIMRMKLLAAPADPESSDPPLVDVYKRSYDLCVPLYEKELLTDTSYLYIYGLHEAELNAQQLAVVSGLSQWRDSVARAEDESTGYILPNRTLLEIAKQMPLTTNQLRRILKSKLPYIEKNLGTVVSIVRHSVQNSSQFEEGVKYLKERKLEMSREVKAFTSEEPEASPSEDPAVAKIEANTSASAVLSANPKSEDAARDKDSTNGRPISVRVATSSAHADRNDSNTHKLPEVSVQILKKPGGGLGAMLGNSVKRRLEPARSENKLEQIKSCVSLPFHTFSGGSQPETKPAESPPKTQDTASESDSARGLPREDIITLDDSEDEPSPAAATSQDESKPPETIKVGSTSDPAEVDEESMSLDELSSSFERCLASPDRGESPESVAPQSSKSPSPLPVKPFDYEAARSQVKFGENRKEDGHGNIRKKVGNKISQPRGQSQTDEPSQGRRRQAFPASGNRSATFR